MSVQVKALHALSHDQLRLARGEVGEMSESAANELASKGLVEVVKAKKAAEPEVKKAAPVENKKAAEPENKAKR